MVALAAQAQNYATYSFGTQQMEYVLFPQDEYGNVSFSDTIQCNSSKSELQNKFILLIYDLEHLHNIDISDLLKVDGAIRFTAEIPVGGRYISVGVCSSDNIGTFKQSLSTVEFLVSITYIDNQFAYSLNNFETRRRRIQGEAKENGKPNIINWQRINSLIKERKEYEGKKSKRARKNYDEKTQLIESEKNQYQAEYDAVKFFISRFVELLNK